MNLEISILHPYALCPRHVQRDLWLFGTYKINKLCGIRVLFPEFDWKILIFELLGVENVEWKRSLSDRQAFPTIWKVVNQLRILQCFE